MGPYKRRLRSPVGALRRHALELGALGTPGMQSVLGFVKDDHRVTLSTKVPRVLKMRDQKGATPTANKEFLAQIFWKRADN